MNVSFEELTGLLGAAHVRLFALEKELMSMSEQMQSLVDKYNKLQVEYNELINPSIPLETEKVNGRLEQSNKQPSIRHSDFT